MQYIVLMLGTNDCKADKTRSAEEVGIGMDKLIRLVIGMLPAWTKILLVCPPPLGASAPQRDRSMTRSRSPCRMAWQSSTA